MTEIPSPKQVKYLQGKHPNSLKNLKPFKPGENGDKPGQGYSLTAELKHALRDRRKELVNSTIEGAILRETTPFKEVWDRVEGKLTDPIPAGYQDNRTINIIVSSEKAKELTENVAKRLYDGSRNKT